MSEEAKNTPLMQDLWDRRFFQFGATYLGVSWALIQFMDWIVNRYDLSQSMVDKLIIFFVVMLPAVLVFIYNHGRPGDDEWKPLEKVFLPGSFVLGLVLAIFLFDSNSAQATTKTVTLVNEEGDSTTRVVPTAEFTNNFVIFPFSNLTGDASNDWMEVGSAYLLDKDLEQDMRNFSIQPLSLKYYYESYNHTYLDEIPFATQLNIAQDYYSDFFITGDLKKEGTEFVLDTRVYQTNNGQEFYRESLRGQTLFEVIDLATRDISNQLYLPESQQNIEWIDLPADNLVSKNMEALSLFIIGQLKSTVNIQNLSSAIVDLEKSVQLDPNCGECFAALAELYLSASDETKGRQYSEKSVHLLSALPERQQLGIRFINYLIKNQVDKAILLAENWRKVYSNDYTPYNRLISFYKRTFQWDKAKEVALNALENGHKGELLKTLAELYVATKEFDEAEKYMQEFARLYPHKAKEKSLLGEIYVMKGELDKAKTFYSDHLVMEPNDIDAYIQLGIIEQKLGNFDEAYEYAQEALVQANQTQDSISILGYLESYYDRLGQFEKSFETNAEKQKLQSKIYPQTYTMQVNFFPMIAKYVVTGREELFQTQLDELVEKMPQSKPLLNCVGHFIYYLSKENLEELEKNVDLCSEMILRSLGKNFQYAIDGAVFRLKGDYENSILSYQTYVDSSGVGEHLSSFELGEVYRKAGKLDEAEQFIMELLKLDPNQPQILLEASKVFHEMKESDKAREYCSKVLDIWSNADDNYIHFQEAKEFCRELGIDVNIQ